ncbi:hypothetical protein WN51_00086 [Melipona quadrifasciata]|uniref:Uncharacterized protein n=1 Tax=Melipona quadrifasciata TaxID=166423 RepID=A0A0M9ADY5_9HYME|nr:hypothetical protein WN51_00086 [Melipona quadrifasciata]
MDAMEQPPVRGELPIALGRIFQATRAHKIEKEKERRKQKEKAKISSARSLLADASAVEYSTTFAKAAGI